MRVYAWYLSTNRVKESGCCKLTWIAFMPSVDPFLDVVARDISRNPGSSRQYNFPFVISATFACLNVLLDNGASRDKMGSATHETRETTTTAATSRSILVLAHGSDDCLSEFG